MTPPPPLITRKRHSSRTLNRAPRARIGHGISPRVGKFFERSFPFTAVAQSFALVCAREAVLEPRAFYASLDRNAKRVLSAWRRIVDAILDRHASPYRFFFFFFMAQNYRGKEGRGRGERKICMREPRYTRIDTYVSIHTYCIGDDSGHSGRLAVLQS